MIERLNFFTGAEGNLLIRLLLAHLASDFILQTTGMVANKKWFSKYMLWHIAIVFILTSLHSWNIWLAASITLCHWLIDSIKIEALKRKFLSETSLFITDQLLHIIVIVLLWSVFLSICHPLFNAIIAPFIHYQWSLILTGYIFITTPVGYLIKYATKNINTGSDTNIQHGGKMIGIFERIIVLTFVLLGQYQAIGFLITGKSIIRFAGKDDHLRSEYVLVGTMMSYAISILTGVAINWLLSLR